MNHFSLKIFLFALLVIGVPSTLAHSLPKGRLLTMHNLKIDDIESVVKRIKEQDRQVMSVKERVKSLSTNVDDRLFVLEVFMKKLKDQAEKTQMLNRRLKMGQEISEAEDSMRLVNGLI